MFFILFRNFDLAWYSQCYIYRWFHCKIIDICPQLKLSLGLLPKFLVKILLNFLLFFVVVPLELVAQQGYSKTNFDTSYIADYHDELITRVFGSRKYTTYTLDDKGYGDKLKYRPNSPFNIGFGFNYKLIGLNLGFNLPIINDTKEYGKTRFIDLQTHVYGRRLIVDVYVQRYKGFYLPNTSILSNNNFGAPYIRSDMRVFNAGLEFQYLVNWKRFTLRGAFLHNEVQRKSAGSPILGAYLGYVSVDGDSALIPQNLAYNGYFNEYRFHNTSIRSANLNFGYGYTFVLPYSFFITAAASAGVGINFSEIRSVQKSVTSGTSNNVSGTFRIGLGYNGRRLFTGIHYAGTRASHNTPIQYARQEFGAGNFRISIAHRFTLKKKLFGFY